MRDAAELRAAAVGICALGLMPPPTEKRNEGQSNVAVLIQGVGAPGDWFYADGTASWSVPHHCVGLRAAGRFAGRQSGQQHTGKGNAQGQGLDAGECFAQHAPRPAPRSRGASR